MTPVEGAAYHGSPYKTLKQNKAKNQWPPGRRRGSFPVEQRGRSEITTRVSCRVAYECVCVIYTIKVLHNETLKQVQ